jgi:hypothetical protein
MGQVGFARGCHFSEDELALARDGEGDPLGLSHVTPLSDEVKAANGKALAEELFGDVAYRNYAAPAEDYAFDFWRAVRKPKNAAGRDKLRDISGCDSKTAIAETEENEGLGLGYRGHGAKLGDSPAWEMCEGRLLDGVASVWRSPDDADSSSRASSSRVRKPSGLTTGMTA